MAKWLALVGFVCLLLLPVVLFLGRSQQLPCPSGSPSPCDPAEGRPAWTIPAFGGILLLALVLLGAALALGIKNRARSRQSPD